jgi:hypothetical protein
MAMTGVFQIPRRDVNGNIGNSNRGNNNTNDDDDDTGFGDSMGPLNENHLRIGF